MANMSYCRLHNTRLDMGDCLESLREAEWGDEEIREEEIGYCINMFEDILDYLMDQGVVELDETEWDRWCEKVRGFKYGEVLEDSEW